MKKIVLVIAALATMAGSVLNIANAQGVDVRIGGGDRDMGRDRGEIRGDRDRIEMRGDRDRGEMRGERERVEMRGDRDRGELRSGREYRERDRGFRRNQYRTRSRVVVIKRRYRRSY